MTVCELSFRRERVYQPNLSSVRQSHRGSDEAKCAILAKVLSLLHQARPVKKLRRLVKTNSFALHLDIAAIEESWSKKEGGKGEDV